MHCASNQDVIAALLSFLPTTLRTPAQLVLYIPSSAQTSPYIVALAMHPMVGPGRLPMNRRIRAVPGSSG